MNPAEAEELYDGLTLHGLLETDSVSGAVIPENGLSGDLELHGGSWSVYSIRSGATSISTLEDFRTKCMTFGCDIKMKATNLRIPDRILPKADLLKPYENLVINGVSWDDGATFSALSNDAAGFNTLQKKIENFK